MNLRVPYLDRTKYRGVLPDVAATYVLEFERLQKELRAAQRDRDAAQPDESAQMQRVGQEVADYLRQEAKRATGRDRQAALAAIGAQLGHHKRYSFVRGGEVEALHRECAALFSEIDVEGFVAEWRKAFPPVSTDRLTLIDAEITRLESELVAHRVNALEAFGDGPAPLAWEELRANAHDPDSAAGLAHAVCCRLVADWRRMADQFGAPVTVSATLIASMSGPQRKAAERGYTALGLKPGSPGTYLPYDAKTGNSCASTDPRIGVGHQRVFGDEPSWARRTVKAAAKAVGISS